MTIVVFAVIAALVAVIFLPMFRIYGDSMSGTLDAGQLVAAVRDSDPENGDIVAFDYNNNILIKRVIARGGDSVEIGEDGTVYVNGEALEETYLIRGRSPGESDIAYPFTVPDGQFFVLNDNREESADSRSASLGCVSGDQIAGRIVFRIWPLNRIGIVR